MRSFLSVQGLVIVCLIFYRFVLGGPPVTFGRLAGKDERLTALDPEPMLHMALR
jgi:hypothetical protein